MQVLLLEKVVNLGGLGDVVKADQLLAQIDPLTFRQAVREAQAASAQASSRPMRPAPSTTAVEFFAIVMNVPRRCHNARHAKPTSQ